METPTTLPALIGNAPRITPGNDRNLLVPSWDTSRKLVFPFLESVSCSSRALPSVGAQTEYDPLSGMLTGCIKMTLSLFWNGAIIPLSESLLREWAVTIAAVRLAMDANLSLVAQSSRLLARTKGSLSYYSLQTDASPFNSALPFYAPFQGKIASMLGSPFYFAVPERRTVILFGAESLPFYLRDLRDDVLLTRDTSTSALSPELIEVSDSGVLPVYR
jgi:hypothetical protein